MKKLIFITGIMVAGLPSLVFAACAAVPPAPCPGTFCLPNPLKYETFGCLVDAVIDFIFVVSIALVPAMVILGAFYFMTAAGDPNRVKTAKTIFLYTGVGLILVLCAKGVIQLVNNLLGLR